MEHLLTWEVLPLDTPAVKRFCSKCNEGAEFVSTGRFRINAQQRNLDVFLIWQCKKCKTTWNMTVHTRVKPEDLPPDLYRSYLVNDPETAMRCAFDKQLLMRNKAGVSYEAVEYEVKGGDHADLAGNGVVRVLCPYAFDLRADRLFSAQFGLSRATAERLFETGAIRRADGQGTEIKKLRRHKLGEESLWQVSFDAVREARESSMPEHFENLLTDGREHSV